MAEGKKYVVYGMRAKCSEGSMENYISTDTGHGVLYQGQPVLNANDHVEGVNLTHFGDCKSKLIFEEAKKQADEKYKTEEGDGFFKKLGKGIAKFATKASLVLKETLGSNKCQLETPLPWIFTSRDHMIDGAPALTLDSCCACKFGGVITIVPQEEEVNSEQEELEIESKETPIASTLASKNAIVGMQMVSLEGAKANKVSETNNDYIEKYVSEEALKKINKQWDMQSLKKLCGDDAINDLKMSMHAAGITDEKSVLMFLCTLGVESGYGKRTSEMYTDKYLSDKSYMKNTRGAGLIQLTGETQKEFLIYIRDTLKKDDTQKEVINEYINAFGKIGNKTSCSKDATSFIAEKYPIDSATWFWAKNKEKCTYYNTDGTQQNISINEYINMFPGNNSDNLFLVSQYYTNSQRWKKTRLQEMCESSKVVKPYSKTQTVIEAGKEVKKVSYHVDYAGATVDAPNGWYERSEDWENAKKLMTINKVPNKNRNHNYEPY